jgi:hypothetical protein
MDSITTDGARPSKATARRLLIHADTELRAKDLLNNRMAYVAVSRGDEQIFSRTARSWSRRWDMMFRIAAPIAPEMKPRTETGAGSHAAAGDRAAAGAEIRYWLGTLVKRLGLRTPALAYGFSRFVC